MSSKEGKLEEMRKRIDEIDDTIADLLSKRMGYAKEAKKEKDRRKQPVSDKRREREVVEKWSGRSRGRDLNEEMMRKIAEIIIHYTLKKETEEG